LNEELRGCGLAIAGESKVAPASPSIHTFIDVYTYTPLVCVVPIWVYRYIYTPIDLYTYIPKDLYINVLLYIYIYIHYANEC